jgi:ATP-dependent DNA ligase
MEGSAGEALFRYACAMNLEGIVSKKVTAPYLSGRRSRIGHPPSRQLVHCVTA